MAKVSSAQEALVRQLSVLEVHQGEINETLKARLPRFNYCHAMFLNAPCPSGMQGMETELDKLSSDTDPLVDEAKERDELFATAEQVSAQLARISTELCDAIELVNSDRAAGQPPSGDPLASAQKILNNQLSTLIWLEKKAQEIAKRVEHLDL